MPQLFSWSESPDSNTVKGSPGKAQKNPGVGKIELGVQGRHSEWCSQGKVSERKPLLGGTESTGDLKKVPLRPFAEYIQHMYVKKLPKVGE